MEVQTAIKVALFAISLYTYCVLLLGRTPRMQQQHWIQTDVDNTPTKAWFASEKV